MLSQAEKDGVIASNPARGLAREMKLRNTRDDEVKAMTEAQLARFLAVGGQREPLQTYAAFLTYALTGLRLGEGLGLLPEDVDVSRRRIRVRRQVRKNGTVGPTKGKKLRDVDLPRKLERVFRDLIQSRKVVSRSAGDGGNVFQLAAGGGDSGPWLLFPEIGDPPAKSATINVQARLRSAFARTLKRAGLSSTFSPHSLRHTFASNLLNQGESLFYVSRMLGHASIKMTADVYGSWLPTGDPAVTDRFAARVLGGPGNKVVTEQA